ncbi:MarR family transcriptional regulator [Halomicroarcula sp. S1AR25-4]|uniref:hypothetical protein n=1 Tax=Haloarcula sp. S1AR25-4 TaxID=2950538 RepID=UPI0028770E31|nr:hypothetical protein [Halomicroarcula sp. S1AR25-4]MDS0277364.1 MarR family transcriptional regulator [Halomicroarcula sp. S1AR25-4]
MTPEEIDLAREDLEVLHAIVSAHNPVTTSTLREQLHWADSSRKVRYRLDNLEQRGLIETRKDDDRSPAHQMPVRVAAATDAGHEIAEAYEDAPETLPLEVRVARLENQMSPMRNTYGKVKKRIAAIEEDLEEHDADLEEVAEEIQNIKRFLDDSSSRTSASDSDV